MHRSSTQDASIVGTLTRSSAPTCRSTGTGSRSCDGRTNLQQVQHNTKTVDGRAARPCRTKVATGARRPRWTHHQVHESPRVRPRSPVETQIYSVTDDARCPAGRDPCARTISYNSQRPSSSSNTTHLAMDKLGSVNKVGGADFSIKEY